MEAAVTPKNNSVTKKKAAKSSKFGFIERNISVTLSMLMSLLITLKT